MNRLRPSLFRHFFLASNQTQGAPMPRLHCGEGTTWLCRVIFLYDRSSSVLRRNDRSAAKSPGGESQDRASLNSTLLYRTIHKIAASKCGLLWRVDNPVRATFPRRPDFQGRISFYRVAQLESNRYRSRYLPHRTRESRRFLRLDNTC